MDTKDFDTKRESLLNSVLDHVPFDGWTMTAINAAAKESGIEPAFVHRAFPNGPVDAIDLHNQIADRNMLVELSKSDLDAMRVREIVTKAVRIRLEQNTTCREAVRRALPILALPQNLPAAVHYLRRTVDAIWYAAGDTATDHNFYTKRALLSGVFSSTMLCWLNDRSEGQATTWAFLDRRIDEVMNIPKLTQRLAQPFKEVQNPFSKAGGFFGFGGFSKR